MKIKPKKGHRMMACCERIEKGDLHYNQSLKTWEPTQLGGTGSVVGGCNMLGASLSSLYCTKRPVCETCKGKGYILPLYHHPMGARIERCDACKMFSGDLQATVAFFNTPESNGYSLRHIVLNTPAQAVKSSKPSFRIAGVIIGISGLKAFNKAQHKKGGKK
jgi:hypothetical protein